MSAPTPSPIRVAIVDDNPEFRESLSAWLRLAPGVVLAAACSEGAEALRVLPEAKPDVVLMDINLPGRSGIDCLRDLRQQLTRSALLMLTIEQESRKLMESLEAGADGYLVKTTPPARLLEAIQEAYAGGSPISSHMARLLVQRFRGPEPAGALEPQLSPREEQILNLLAGGRRAKEVADQLGISVHTVRAGVRSIYRKLPARSVPEAVAKLLRAQQG
jgi:DNA-binding NarL/FixJ family response regulator